MLTETSEKRTQAEMLVMLAMDFYDFVYTEDGDFLAIPKGGYRVTKTLRGSHGSVQKELARIFHKATGRVATDKAIRDALAVVEGIAALESPKESHIRVARKDRDVYVDIGDSTGRALHVSPEGWRTMDEPPVLFRRTALTAPLPEPVRGGTLDELLRALPVPEPDAALMLGYIVASFIPDIPHPVLNVVGEQGSGKSRLCRQLVSIIDPSRVPARKPPRDLDSWITACQGSWAVNIDNLSLIPDWLSDSFCRTSTGEGDVRRKLFSDSDIVVFNYRRVLIINGISFTQMREDLADRTIQIELPIISRGQRRTEMALDELWTDVRPRALGAILDLLAQVLRVLPDIEVRELPRMADFGRIQGAVDAILGLDGLSRMESAATRRSVTALSNDMILTRICENIDAPWVGTASELLEHVAMHSRRPLPVDWPKDGREMTTVLKRRAPSLRADGWSIEDLGSENKSNTKRWRIVPPTIDELSFDGLASMASMASDEFSISSTSLNETREGEATYQTLAILAERPTTGGSTGRQETVDQWF